jgi:hypothetical protein
LTNQKIRLSLLKFAESLGPIPRTTPSHVASFLDLLGPEAPTHYPVLPSALTAGMRRSDEKRRILSTTVTYGFSEE